MDSEYYQGSIIPETRDEARAYIEQCWDRDGELAGCDALVDFRVECRRVLSAWESDRQGIDWGVPSVMSYCMIIPSGPGILETLRVIADGEDEYNSMMSEAVEHLKAAAKIMSVDEALFLGIPKSTKNKNSQERMASFNAGLPITPAEPQKLVGEATRERSIRRSLWKHMQGERMNNEQRLRSYDKRHGAGSSSTTGLNKMFIRMLWDVWPERLKDTIQGVWQPNLAAAQMLQHCGHDVSPRDISRYKSEIKSAAVDAERRKHEVPGS